jgi:hypothetical protein
MKMLAILFVLLSVGLVTACEFDEGGRGGGYHDGYHDHDRR